VSATPPLRASATAGLRAIVLADGDGPDRAALDARWPDWSRGIGFVVAADGGARLAAPLGLRLDAWVGDGDSLSAAEIEQLRTSGVPVELVPADKD
jgi:thiamine pyrophosphokinase